jgi:hypothetical protein
VHSHSLDPESGRKPWRLEWDDKHLILRNSEGSPVVEVETGVAHRRIDLSKAFVDGTICISGPEGPLRFKQNRAALAELDELVKLGLQSDPEYRRAMRQQARRGMAAGAAMFLVAGGIFGSYCWSISWMPEPPADHWIRWIAGLFTWVLAVLMAVTLLGLGLGCSSLRLWWRIRSVERMAPAVDKD